MIEKICGNRNYEQKLNIQFIIQNQSNTPENEMTEVGTRRCLRLVSPSRFDVSTKQIPLVSDERIRSISAGITSSIDRCTKSPTITWRHCIFRNRFLSLKTKWTKFKVVRNLMEILLTYLWSNIHLRLSGIPSVISMQSGNLKVAKLCFSQ